jgi:hypothetical protein
MSKRTRRGFEPNATVHCPCCFNNYDTDDDVPFTAATFDLHSKAAKTRKAAKALVKAARYARATLETVQADLFNEDRKSQQGKSLNAPIRRLSRAIAAMEACIK